MGKEKPYTRREFFFFFFKTIAISKVVSLSFIITVA